FKKARPAAARTKQYLEKEIQAAHKAVVKLGEGRIFEEQPRTTITLCTIANGNARWAHVGDSRVYVFRNGELLARTRDHSAVEEMYRKGLITEADMHTHPLRNYVEHCLGGEARQPDMAISERHTLQPGDIVLLSSDGFWAPLDITALGQALHSTDDLQAALEDIAEQAENATKPFSDNVTAVAFRWLEEEE
ncbi:MAG TPA: PP2C family serine/threonine-protein phosphatase, partial [Gammaproteobacteria bacterium]|nr:PP2C family serine/threonine-protein phosphatase [Gammaproteobacteria bacterium]